MHTADANLPRYDVHTHVGLDTGFVLRGWWPYAATAQDLLQHMRRCGIDRALCFPFCLPSAFDPYAFADEGRITPLPGRVPYDRENTLLVQEIDRIDSARRLGVLAMFDPAREVAAQVSNLQPLADRIVGLKVQGTIIQSRITALLDESSDLMGFAADHDMPVLIHTAAHADDPWSQVADCLRVAEANPRVRFNLAHSLRFDLAGLREAAAMPNVWVDCSAHLAHCEAAAADAPIVPPRVERVNADYTDPTAVLEAVHAIIGDSYLWGSDNPFMSWVDDSMAAVHTYDAEVAAIDAAPSAVRTSMLSTAPAAWIGSRASVRWK